METTRGWKAAVIISLLLTSSCRFKFPNSNEGQLLASQGAFPNSLPGWVKAPDDMGAARVSRDGLIPQSYGAAQVVKNANATSGSQAVREEQTEQDNRAKEALARTRAASEVTVDESSSPLDRIESVCPGIEADVTDALKTIDIQERIKKYDTLTVRCSKSADLWFWLARDYHSAKRFAESVRAYEQVLLIDPKNQAAQALLDEARQGATAR